ncbi:MAG: MBL fold metallo-hydrolase [Myxococcota bacterium]|nr:MBL fold metallo-hydrolase [Myxococcota bacterium]
MQTIFRCFQDADTKTLTYLIGDPWSREAVFIDPVRAFLQRDLTILRELGLTLVHCLETHIHADHVTGGGLLRERTGCTLIVGADNDVDGIDVCMADGDAVRFGLQALEVRATPGHTDGCVSYVSANEPRVFTGDALLIRGCGRTDFQSGNPRTLFRSIRDKLFSLPDETLVHPAHDYQGRSVSSIREERLYNPRLGGQRTEAEFVSIMDGLGLPYPRQIDVAVPANLRCGYLEDEPVSSRGMLPGDTAWELFRTPLGAPNVTPSWVADNRHQIRLVDIRTVEEWSGPDGRIDGAEHSPDIATNPVVRVGEDAQYLVLYCRSGGRSDRLAKALELNGAQRVASMKGGILRWKALGLGLAGDTQG